MEKAKVLVVEDDKFLRELFIKKLTLDGFSARNAVDAQSAYRMLGEEVPDIVLLDLILPGEDGFSILEKIKKDARVASVPVVVLSNLGQQEDIDRAMALGALDYWIKANYTLDEIITRIKGILEKKGKERK
jgi:DNA-binding response OmpR family regulator